MYRKEKNPYGGYERRLWLMEMPGIVQKGQGDGGFVVVALKKL